MYGSNANIVASGSISRFVGVGLICWGWPILLGRVDLRVDRNCFRNNIKIQDSLSAVSHASHSRSGTGRHGGRPSQEPEANIAAVPDDTEVIPPKIRRA
jgi:hypothetical protein